MKASEKATISDVAQAAGVSIKTVSRVVNQEPNVRPLTRMRVERAIAQLNYRPNISARNLASSRARLIVLVYDDPAQYEVPSSGYVLSLQEGVMRVCKRRGYELVIHPCACQHENVREELKRLIERMRPTGIVLAAPLSNNAVIVDVLGKTGVPFIPLSRGDDNSTDFSIATNDRTFSAEMTRHLLSLGHRRIGFIRGNRAHAAVSNRYLGYEDALRDAGLEPNPAWVAQGDNSIESGERSAMALLESQPRPTAIFAANDDMAAGVIRAANRLGLRVPEELSVAGFDDIPLARQIYPSLTTVYQPLVEMAEAAAEALTGNRSPDHGIMVVPGELRIRASTGPAPAVN